MHVDYPKSLFDIFVVADNCTDNTAEVSRDMGVNSLVRNDLKNRGKGHALKWFFEKAITENWLYDVFLLLDADSIVTNNILKAMNERFFTGASALTTAYSILHGGSYVTTSITYMGFLLRNLRSNGINKIGGSVPLLGNGMGFSRQVIDKYGWNATSITEDREYWAILHNNGVRVGFIDEASVYGQIPPTFKSYAVPRARWDMGEFNVFKKNIILFLINLLKRKDIVSSIAFLELFTPPFTIFFLFSCLFFLTVIPITNNFYLLTLGLINIFLLISCVFIGYLKSNKKSGIHKKIILYLPFFIVWRIWNTIRVAFSPGKKEWVRTPRHTKSKE